jgi:hypothetical protein
MYSASKAGLRALLAGAAVAAALAAAGVAHAQAVVVRSTGPSAAQYPQGKRLPANVKVTLRGGDRVTVLDKAGTRVLSGPGSFTLDSSVSRDRGTASRVGGIIAGGTNPRARTGAVRGAPIAAPPIASGPDSIWYVDVTRGGHYCVANPTSLVLWRPNRVQAAEAKLTATTGGKSAKVAWPKGSALKIWPADLPVRDGAVYTFSDPVGPSVTITTHLLASVPADEMEIAGLLGDRGCLAQLDVLANAASPTPSGG